MDMGVRLAGHAHAGAGSQLECSDVVVAESVLERCWVRSQKLLCFCRESRRLLKREFASDVRSMPGGSRILSQENSQTISALVKRSSLTPFWLLVVSSYDPVTLTLAKSHPAVTPRLALRCRESALVNVEVLSLKLACPL